MRTGPKVARKERNADFEQNSSPLIVQSERLVLRTLAGEPQRPLLAFQVPSHLLASSTYGEALAAEAHQLLQLRHPCIPQLFEANIESDQAYYTIQDLGYEPLNSFLAPSARGSFEFIQAENIQEFSEEERLSLIADCASALAAAHALGVCHGSLGAADLFVTRGKLLVTGFGRTLNNEESLSADNLDAWSPERSTGEQLTYSTDYFAWGVLAFRLLVGQLPFEVQNSEQGATKVVLQPQRLSAGFELLKSSPLAKHDHYQEFLLALRKSLSPSPVERTIHFGVLSSQLRKLTSTPNSIAYPLSTKAASWWSLLQNWRFYVVSAPLLLVCGLLVTQPWSAEVKDNSQAISAGNVTTLAEDLPQPLYLRVLAEPWAYVLLDGKRRETTPFARPLRLSPGRHEIVLEHPSAPRERRVIEGLAGETITLSVQMQVKQPIDWRDMTMAAPKEQSP